MRRVRWWPCMGVVMWWCGCGGPGAGAPEIVQQAEPSSRGAVTLAPTPVLVATPALPQVDFSEVAEPAEAAAVTVPRRGPVPAWCTGLKRHPVTQARPPLECATVTTARELLGKTLREAADELLGSERQRVSCDSPPASAVGNEKRPGRGRPSASVGVERLTKQDAELARLEACDGFPSGFIHALRAYLALPCADVLASGYRPVPSASSARYHNALLGLAIAAQLARRRDEAPAFRSRSLETAPAHDFIDHTLRPWLETRERELFADQALVAQLPSDSHGGAWARLAFAAARRRLLRAARSAEIPDEWKKDHGARVAFYSHQLEMLAPFYGRPEPFSAFAAVEQTGAVRSFHQELLVIEPLQSSKRSALELVLLPPAPLPDLDSAASRLAAALPPFFTGELLAAAELAEPDVLRAALLQGLSPAARQALSRIAISSESRELLMRGQLVLALLSASPSRARRASVLGRQVEQASAELRLLRAVSEVFASIGDDVSFRNSSFAPAAPNVDSLLQLARGAGVVPAAAAFNAHAFSLLASPLTDSARELALSYAQRGIELFPADAPRACVHRALGQSSGWFPHCPCPLTWPR